MIRVSVIYPRTENARFDLDYYINTHMPLVVRLYADHGLFDWNVDQGVSLSSKRPSEFIVTCYMYFDTIEQAKSALKTQGPKVMQDLTNFTDIVPQVTVGQIHATANL